MDYTIIDTTNEPRKWNNYKTSGILKIFYPCCKKLIIGYGTDRVERCKIHETVPVWETTNFLKKEKQTVK